MCGICGCQNTEHLHYSHDQNDHHLIQIEQDILAQNNRYSEMNHDYFVKNKILALNVMSGPGSGKTTLLARTFADLKEKIPIGVIVGDQQTDHDAALLQSSGAPAVQVTTGKVCHLDAHMVGHAVEKLPVNDEGMIIFIENVGNLVCPALFNLGEKYKIVMLSVTEGENKPVKYPDIFRFAQLMIITKIDLLPYLDFDLEKCIHYAKQINPDIEVLTLSAKKGEGLSSWYDWLLEKSKWT